MLLPGGEALVVREPAMLRLTYYFRIGLQGPTPVRTVAKPRVTPQAPVPKIPANTSSPAFWDRWGDAFYSCTGATFAGAAIYMTGGVATPVVSTLLYSSALMCGVNLGKGYAYPLWQEFERNGGLAYHTWMKAETAATMLDVYGGYKTVVATINLWRRLGKFGPIMALIKGKSLNRREYVQAIRKVFPNIDPKLASKSVSQFNKAISVTILGHAKTLTQVNVTAAFLDALVVGLGLGGQLHSNRKYVNAYLGT